MSGCHGCTHSLHHAPVGKHSAHDIVTSLAGSRMARETIIYMTYLENDRFDESIHGRSEGRGRWLEVPEDYATLREDGEQIQHL